MKKKRLIFFLSVPYDKFFEKKHLIHKAKKYFNIKYYSIENFYREKKSKNKKNIFIIRNFSDLSKNLNKHKPELGLMLHDDIHHLKVGKICQEDFNMKLAYMGINLIPESYVNRNLKLMFKILFSKFFFNYIYQIIKRLKLSFSKLLNIGEKKFQFKFDFAIIGGNSGVKINTVANSKKIIKSQSYDLEESLKFKNKIKNYAVFLDENLFNHRDYKLLNNKRYVSKLYFREINSFFDFFEKKYKTKILISLHPRTTQISINKKYFNNRKCFIDKSHKLVSSCKYVFLHPSTTALNLPIIYKKPAIFLTTDELLERLELKARIERRKLNFDQPFINLSKFKTYNYPKNFNYIDHEGYKKYMNDFIGSRNNNLKRGIWWDFYKHSD